MSAAGRTDWERTSDAVPSNNATDSIAAKKDAAANEDDSKRKEEAGEEEADAAGANEEPSVDFAECARKQERDVNPPAMDMILRDVSAAHVAEAARKAYEMLVKARAALPPTTCTCGKPSRMQISRTKQNPWKLFFGCAKYPRGHCNFFSWAG